MEVSSQSCETHRVLNVLQIIFMNGVFMLALVLLFWTFGKSLMLSLAIGWIGAPVLTFGVGSMVYFADRCRPVSRLNARVGRKTQPMPMSRNTAHLLDVWNADRKAEREDALAQMSLGVKYRPDRLNDAKVVRMLEGNSASDKAVQARERPADRRQFKAHPHTSDAFRSESRKYRGQASKRSGQA